MFINCVIGPSSTHCQLSSIVPLDMSLFSSKMLIGFIMYASFDLVLWSMALGLSGQDSCYPKHVHDVF